MDLYVVFCVVRDSILKCDEWNCILNSKPALGSHLFGTNIRCRDHFHKNTYSSHFCRKEKIMSILLAHETMPVVKDSNENLKWFWCEQSNAIRHFASGDQIWKILANCLKTTSALHHVVTCARCRCDACGSVFLPVVPVDRACHMYSTEPNTIT